MPELCLPQPAPLPYTLFTPTYSLPVLKQISACVTLKTQHFSAPCRAYGQQLPAGATLHW